ncbi:RNA-directed DNA polymerase, eukaryota, partial [Tanacetum coccineum]
MMPSQFSKEDHIIRISKSVFVSNFPDSFRSHDLWNLCEPYGKVVDVFIPNRKSKDGKSFAFVRFIKVDDLEPLIGNLCTLWVGRFHLHANAARYERPINSAPSVRIPPPYNSKLSSSYAAAVNGSKSSYCPPASPLSPPALVLDDTFINECDFSRHVMGKVKDLNSIPNLQTILAKEGFAEVKLSYLGGFWVLLELENANTKEKLLQHTGVNSWFLDLQVATNDFVCDERVVWVDIEGIPLNVWSHATFLKIGKKWGEVMDVEENLGPSFARKRLCIKTNLTGNILESFKVIFKGKVYMVRAKELFTWTPRFLEYKDSDYISDDEASIGANNNQVRPQHGYDHLGVESDEERVSETIFGDKLSSPCN